MRQEFRYRQLNFAKRNWLHVYRMNASSNLRPPVETRPWQFSVGSLLWLMVTTGMVLAYMRSYSEEIVPLLGGATAIAVALGLLLGWRFGRPLDGMIWAVIGMLLAVLCAVDFWNNRVEMFLTWAGVGTIGGALAGSWPAGRRVSKLLACTLGAGLAMGGSVLLGYIIEPAIDLPCAAAGGLILAILSDVVTWLQQQYRTSRDVWAAGLVFAVIVGNVIAAAIIDRIT